MSGMEKWEYLKIPLADIIHATNGFRKEIGRGGYGPVYEGELAFNGKHTKIAVKKLIEKHGQGFKEFLTEIDLLSGQQHENIINLVGYCDEENEKIIVYEYAERGSLDRYIRCSNATKYTLTWLERLKIVVDVARGLDHLHNHLQNNQVIIHRDIKSSNILLDHNWVAKISDLGLSKSTFSGFSRTTVISHACGTMGYVEPEYVRSGRVTKKSDVFSFGMVLFEVLCGRLCTLRDKDGILLLADIAKEHYANNKLDMLIDPYLWEQMSPNSLIRYSAIAYKCLLGRMHRPLMDVVRKELEEMLKFEMQREEIRRIKSVSKSEEDIISETERLKTISTSCEEDITSDEYLNKKLRLSLVEINRATDKFASKKLLREGSSGKVYRGNISGIEVAMKRINMAEEQRFPGFQKEIDLLSGCDHINIISLVGYCDEEDEKILVYEYMPKGSLYDYLYEHQDDTPRLTMEQRLEICIGVAKGLSYLHYGTHYFSTIHGDVKPEHILLDGNLVPKISDFRLSSTRDVGPSISQVIADTLHGTEGYLAPECYEPNYKSSRKADVYAFGVVLLEVLCERPPWKRLVLLALPLIMRGELERLTSQHVKTTISPECLQECENLIMQCVENDPDERPVISVVVDRLELALKLQNAKSSTGSSDFFRSLAIWNE